MPRLDTNDIPKGRYEETNEWYQTETHEELLKIKKTYFKMWEKQKNIN